MDYWQRLCDVAVANKTPRVQEQFQAMAAFRQAVASGQLPEHSLPRLGLSDIDLLGEPLATAAALTQFDHLARNFRQYIAYHYGMWAFVTRDLFAVWQSLFGPQRYLEVAAGNGYVSAGLREQGNDVITTDPLTWVSENATGQNPLVPVRQSGATAALWRYGQAATAIVMAWSPDNEWSDAQFLRVYREHFADRLLFVIGERGGATNSRLFWQLAEFVPDRRLLMLNQAFPRFDAINDRIYLLR